MRYFIYCLPIKSLKRIDIEDNTRVKEVIDMIQDEFDLYVDSSEHPDRLLVLNYNGSDLKPTWRLTDLMIPPGAIIHCLYRENRAAQIYIDCAFNKQVLEFFDDDITGETTVGEIRKKISNKIGLPLSTFCLEKHNTGQRLFDQMNLSQYQIKLNDHVDLKVWRGYEKFLKSCMRGLRQSYSNDDLTRYYELQIALHIASFYGYFALANSALLLGARSDCPVGEHPSRQWSSEETVQNNPEMLICPIHIAIERAHLKIVDLFVRHSLLCTQTPHPMTGFVPYRMALSLRSSAKTKAEKQRYGDIYLYLYDKQFNLKIPVGNSSANIFSTLYKSSQPQAFFSLPRYCQIIRWYERAQERVWKKYGISSNYSMHLKRAHQSRGQLGYRVLIDGFNHNFDAAGRKSRMTHMDRRFRADQSSSIYSQKVRGPQYLVQKGFMGAKMKAINLQVTNQSETDSVYPASSFDQRESQHGEKAIAKSSSSVDQRTLKPNARSYLPRLNLQRTGKQVSEIQPHSDQEIQQVTLKSYERHASASMRVTAANCLQEATHFKGKSWLKKVEISKEMVKQCTKRRMQRAADSFISTSTSSFYPPVSSCQAH